MCVVYTIKKRFEGGDATFMESLSFALSKVHLIVVWSLVVATVGIIMKLIDNAGQKGGAVGQIVAGILNSIIGGVWAIITIFVVPAMVYDNVGPFAAIKSSVETLKKTWGESIIRYLGLGAIQVVLIFGGIIVWLVIFIVLLFLVPVLAFLTIPVLVLYLLIVGLLFSVLNTIFNTALFVYARTGKVPEGYSADIMQNAFKPKPAPQKLF
jgi:hypothetical protein